MKKLLSVQVLLPIVHIKLHIRVYYSMHKQFMLSTDNGHLYNDTIRYVFLPALI